MAVCEYCGQELPPDDPAITVEKNLDGTIKKWIEITSEGKRVDEYTYYKAGEIEEIIQMVYDSKNEVVCNKKITHYLDGSNLTVEDSLADSLGGG